MHHHWKPAGNHQITSFWPVIPQNSNVHPNPECSSQNCLKSRRRTENRLLSHDRLRFGSFPLQPSCFTLRIGQPSFSSTSLRVEPDMHAKQLPLAHLMHAEPDARKKQLHSLFLRTPPCRPHSKLVEGWRSTSFGVGNGLFNPSVSLI